MVESSVQDLYMQDVRARSTRISDSEQRALSRRARRGDLRAREELAESCLYMVVRIVANRPVPNVPFLDQVQQGNEALVRAVKGYNPDHLGQAKFSTYVYKAVQRELASVSQERGPRRGLIESPSAVSLEEGLKWSKVLVNAEEVAMQYIARKETKFALQEAMKSLTERQRLVLEWRYGFLDGEPHSLEETGRAMGVTRERVRQIEAKALKWLRWNKMVRQSPLDEERLTSNGSH